MSRVRAVAGGGRAVEVDPARLPAWFDGFAARNGGVSRTVLADRQVRVEATDGTTATVDVLFEPLGVTAEPVVFAGLQVDALVDYARRERRIGLVLARKGAHSVGVAVGAQVVRSRTDRHLLQGRTAAGGWSQQRFARRREQQGRQALARVADDVLELLGGELATLDAVVLGGDRRALDELRADRRLAPIFAKALTRVLEVGEPRRSLLDEAAVRARAVEIVIRAAV